MTKPTTEGFPSSDVMLSLGRLEGRVEQFLSHQGRHEDRLNDHDTRIGKLELSDSKRSGAMWVGGLLASAIAGVATLAANFMGFFK